MFVQDSVTLKLGACEEFLYSKGVPFLESFSELPWPWILITLLVLCLVAVFLAGAATRNFDPQDRTNDNLARAAITILSGALIFTGAFTIITSWTVANQMRNAAQTEAIVAQGILRTVEVLVPTDTSVATAMANYAESVIQNETGLGGTLEPSLKSEDAFVTLVLNTVNLVENLRVDDLRAQAVTSSVNNLKIAREDRIGELSNQMYAPLIALLLVMSIINLVGIGLFPSGSSRGLKRVYSSVVAIAIACILTSVFVLQSVSFIGPEITAPFTDLLSDASGR